MSRRRVRFADELPFNARRRLWAAGVRVAAAQAWLDGTEIDGCTIAPDLFLPVCAMHDYLCRTGIVRRYWADDWARDCIVEKSLVAAGRMWRDGDELPWRVLGVVWCLLGVVYGGIFWCGVALGDWLGIGTPDAKR